MTETPSGRDGTSAADPSAHPTTDDGPGPERPRRPRPEPLRPGMPADTLALLLLLVVIILLLSLGAFINR